jgi:phosphoadenosine phosphosulfate reductase
MNSKHPETLLNADAFTAESDFSDYNNYFEARPLQDLLEWGLATFGEKLVQVTSFGATGMVILDHLAKLNPGMRVVTVDTGFLFEETYALIEEIQRHYPLEIEVRRSRLTPKVQSRIYRPELWQANPDLCCHVRKVVPLTEVLLGCEAWITGLRRDQAKTRAGLPLITWDAKYGLVKLNPLAGWSRGQVWRYILEHKVPYNPLHDQGYGSIGCHHCTYPTSTTADERSGRWQGLQKVECGIHL